MDRPSNPLATPALVVGIASLAALPFNPVPGSFLLGALAAVTGSLAMRRDHKQGRAVIGMILGLIALFTSGVVNF